MLKKFYGEIYPEYDEIIPLRMPLNTTYSFVFFNRKLMMNILWYFHVYILDELFFFFQKNLKHKIRSQII